MNPKTPILVGVGVITQRDEDPTKAKEALELMVDAALAAARDAGAPELLPMVQWVYVPQGRWQYRDAAGAVACAVGAAGATSVHAKVGVLQQTLIGDACARIAEGEIDAALVLGGEASYRLLRSSITGVEISDKVLTGVSDVVMSPAAEIALDAEVKSGLGQMAVGYYAIIENALRAHLGLDVDRHRDSLATLLRRFSEIAATNPDAWDRTPVDEKFIRDASETNRMLAFPYTKLHTTSWNVDQAAALLFCSAEQASNLGVPNAKWIFPLASSESNHMVPVSARAELHSCPGARIAGKAALDAGDIDITDVDLLELYSCFPVAIEVFAAELGIAMDRPLTVTGGMRFAGGPFNNYVIQSTCRMAQMLRQLPGSRGLVSSVSGVLTKQGFGLWATEPGPNPFAHIDVSAEVANHQETKRVLLDYTGPGTVAGYTVIHEQMSPPPRGVAIIDVADGARTVAYCDATAVTSRMQEEEFSGRNVHVTEGRFEMV